MWSLARLRHRPSTAWLEDYCEEARRRLPQLPAQQVCVRVCGGVCGCGCGCVGGGVGVSIREFVCVHLWVCECVWVCGCERESACLVVSVGWVWVLRVGVAP